MGIRKIAKDLDISMSTVSRALNNQQGVSEQLKDKIIQYAKEINYRPSIMGKSLVNQGRNHIAVIIDNMDRIVFPWNSFMYTKINEEAVKLGFFVELISLEDFIKSSYQFGGCIVLGGEDFLLEENIQNKPTVFIGGDKKGFRVTNNDFLAGEGMAQHFIHKKFDDILCVGFDTQSFSNARRKAGLKSVFERYDLSVRFFDFPLLHNFSLSIAIAFEEYLKNHNAPTAIICSNDEFALALYFIMKHKKLPSYIAGFDGILKESHLITTCRQDFTQIVKDIFVLLSEAQNGQKSRVVKVPFILQTREGL